MRTPAGLLVAIALGVAGCSGDDEDRLPGVQDKQAPGSPGGGAEPRPGEPREAAAIRSWSIALNEEDYEKAASYFAAGAIVEQGEEARLADRGAAIAFNRSLPCKADVTDVDDEGETVIAAFRLRGGPEGGCDGGTARVRFLFRGGKFAEWRQLTEPPPLEGEAT